MAHIVSLRKLEGSRDALLKSRLLLRGIHKKISSVEAEETESNPHGLLSDRIQALTRQLQTLHTLLSDVQDLLEQLPDGSG